jgi:regulatory protein YycI of two-component signal transduction system YycFG
MIDIKKVSQNFFSQKKNIIIIILLIVLVLLGVFFYKKYKTPVAPMTEKEKFSQIMDQDAIEVMKINITEEQKMEMIKKTNGLKANILPPEEARVRDLEIIKNL